ncbi:MAG: histidine phosphatase family protein [Pseudomonadota bacterium]
MKTLLLMRHAKSSWKAPHLIDHQRPLNKRGKMAAPEMARRLKKKGVALDAIISSDARRAMDTAAAVAKTLGMPLNAIRPNTALYHAAPDRLLDTVHRFEDSWHQVLLVGHNPGVTELVKGLYPEPIANVPTAGIVSLTFEATSWRQIGRDRLVSSSFDYPKNKSPS